MKSLLICMTRAPVLFINAKNMSVYDFSEGKEIYRVFVKNTLPNEWHYFFISKCNYKRMYCTVS